MKLSVPVVLCFVFYVLCFGLTGCNPNSAVNKDAQNSFLKADDLVSMTDQMAQSIIADPYVQKETAQRPMIIVIKPIVNETNEIIRGNTKEMYVARVRTLLSGKPVLRDRFVFVLNKEDYEKLRREEGMDEAALGPREERVQPEFVLTGHFYADTEARSNQRSDTYLCVYKLTHLSGPETSVILWEGHYMTHKASSKSFLD
jgi:hypothetical protein